MMWSRVLLLLVVGQLACAPSAYEALMAHQLSPDKPFCEGTEDPPPSRLQEVWDRFAEPLSQGLNGIHVLDDGAGALSARGWLSDNATTSIDIQYFIFSADNVGLIAVERLLAAAERGVQVRLLVDDLLVDGDSLILLALNAHPNVAVRIYNPSINIGKNMAGKLTSMAANFRRVNQRMHNKTFIVDKRVAITGGRNVADEYFDFNREFLFRDRDVLVFGPEVPQVSSSFDAFWTSDLSWPLELVLEKPDDFDPPLVWDKLHRYACDPARFVPTFRERIERVPETWAVLSREGHLVWSDKVRFVSDLPGKNMQKRSLKGGGASTDAMIHLLEGAKESILIQSPYVVLTKLGLGLLRSAIERGVKVHILTNSLASTDNYPAFSGYKRVRKKLLELGVELFEFRPDADLRRTLVTAPVLADASMGLHAKSMVVDEQRVVIGTFNMDPRSANLNTECVVIIDSNKLGKRLAKQMRYEMRAENAWQVSLSENPDSKAGFWKSFQVMWSRLIPRSLL